MRDRDRDFICVFVPKPLHICALPPNLSLVLPFRELLTSSVPKRWDKKGSDAPMRFRNPTKRLRADTMDVKMRQ